MRMLVPRRHLNSISKPMATPATYSVVPAVIMTGCGVIVLPQNTFPWNPR